VFADGRRLVAARLVFGCVLCAALFVARPTGAEAVITQPTVIEGPSSEGIVLGNVAMAPDGTGGLVFTKTVEGKPHVFASRYDGSNWSPPIRVDQEMRLEASEPRIAAGNGGRLLVVWVTPVATTAKGELQRGLYSAAIGAGAGGFGQPLLVDPNLKGGTGAEPSVAGTVPGKAIVAYRVVTHVFGLPGEPPNAGVQLRPGDVLAEVRVARLEGDRWSRLGAINRNPAASMRPPSETNGPQVGIGATGRAVVAWQEPDSSGTARIWMRRVTGTTLGPIFLASPETFEGKPVAEDATALSLSVTPTDRVRLAARVEAGPGSPLQGPRMFLTSLGSSAKPNGAKAEGPELADGGGAPPPGPLGPPTVAAADGGNGAEGAMNLAFTAAGSVRSVGVDPLGKLEAPRTLSGAAAVPGSPVVATVVPEGGGVTAYEGVDESGSATVVARQEFPEGELQTGLLYGPLGGSITQLAGAGSGSGDALLAFCQGESGLTAIVADRISAPPAGFSVTVPEKWVRPGRAKVRWAAPPSAVGGFIYGLVVDGRIVRSRLTRLRVVPPAALLGSGISKVRILATDRLGGEVLSKPVKLRVDARPPTVRVKLQRRQGKVVLRIKDAQSGLSGGSVRVSFGDGSRSRGHVTIHHRYEHAGNFTIKVRARDRVGNRLAQRIEVGVR
jgi:hypothetical protein